MAARPSLAWRIAFDLLYPLLFPFVLLWGLALLALRRSSLREFSQRLGFGPWPAAQRVAWVHVSSMGELAAARPFLQFWKEWSREPMVLSHFYRDVPGALKGDRLFDGTFFLPLENPYAFRFLLRRLKPRRVFFFETEIWPVLLARLAARKVPVCLLNAYIYDKDMPSYRRFPWLFRPALDTYRFIGAQTEGDLKKFVSLGASERRVKVCGDLKYDAALPAVGDAKKLRKKYFPGLPEGVAIAVCGSTHEGEDLDLVRLASRLAQPPRQKKWKVDGVLFVVAPRFIERASAIEGEARACGLPVSRRSAGEKAPLPKGAALGVFILDTVGELREVYAAADLVFVGGSLVAHGGHNPLEPLYGGRRVFIGPHTFKFARMMDELKAYITQTDLPGLEAAWDKALCGKLPPPDKAMGPAIRKEFGEVSRKLAEQVEWAD
ncbi:MAG: hypothetical protein J0L75_20845 [Spirochaetes bacterium]|nr:hypothetical protein [Spirochaetota bacterium]